MHRRTNSYSYSVTSSNIPPPSVLASLKKFDQDLVRNTTERRSYKRTNSGLSANKGYRSVTVSLAVPGQIRYSTQEEEETSSWEDMYRPRSPSNSKALKTANIAIPGLDNTLADIREQLLQMRKERQEIVERLDTLTSSIQDTHQELRLKTVQAQRSPATSLRRIHSLEGGSSRSYTQLDAISDCSSTSSIESSPRSTHLLQRVDSLPSNSFKTMINNSYQRSNSPSVIRRNSSRKTANSPRLLPTIPDDTSVFLVDNESSSDESQISPAAAQVAPLSPSESDNKVLVQPHRSKYQAWPKNNGTNYYTLPTRRSSTPNSPLHKIQFSKSEFTNDGVWDKASVHSIDSSSMILQVSSATGQLEKVPKPVITRQQLFVSTKIGSVENLHDSPPLMSSLPDSSRLSVSSYFIGPGFEDTDSLIMSLSEEPAPSRSNSISSIASSRSNSVSSAYNRTNYNRSGSLTSSLTCSTSPGHRNSLLLNGKETSV